MGIICTIPEIFCESPYFIIEGSNNLKHVKRRVYICSYNHIPIYTNFTTDLTTVYNCKLGGANMVMPLSILWL